MVLTESQQQLSKGDRAPDFSLEGVDGKIYSLDEVSGKQGLLVIFMCNHCPYVLAKIKHIIDLYKKFNNKIFIIGINSNDPNYPGEGMDNMKEFVKKYDIEFPYVLDIGQKVAKKYGATCTPDPFLFNKDLNLVFHGKINDAMGPEQTVREHTMENNIQALINDKEIENWFDPSIGCSIKFTSTE